MIGVCCSFGERRAALEAAEEKARRKAARAQAKGVVTVEGATNTGSAAGDDVNERKLGDTADSITDSVVVTTHRDGATVGALHIPREVVEVAVAYLQVGVLGA